MTTAQLAQIPLMSDTASIVRENILYRYGGVTRTSELYTNAFTQTSVSDNGSLSFSYVKQVNQGPLCSLCQAVLLPDNQTMLVLGGINPIKRNSSMMAYMYRFDNASWSPAPVLSDNGTLPYNRKFFTATLAPNGKVYIYGGIRTLSHVHEPSKPLNDFWSYDPVSRQNGVIAYLTGALTHSTTIDQVPANQTLLYDTNKDTWETRSLEGENPSARENANAILAPNGTSIIMFGGESGKVLWEKQYPNEVAVLDMQTWKWNIVATLGIQPRGRGYASIGLINNTYLMVIGGMNIDTKCLLFTRFAFMCAR
ncbi:hypothetical protein EC973_001629 [Apophysomyces ossiformis]|uniref:Kelch repeat protein n=1 Tax=Apophysomyces ossiformis TaxID=679940 RepID=A0A8H7BY33_9FUNG|nr:hypothetical protein EC973_001629 [Apophysomyces ossiformis]